ncbi:hypothetical protein TGRUB_288550 [Toxoplasma gondii RUB]|uniref:Ankyrin repeat-containing protein n=9 Tax=Toxoplasma gondii TaxID=5811 RepID=B9PTY9_TOXGV|nr:hypothetical protein TGGT1_288550 [Toxoplasma gondii GT1]ESS33801.1 hypothetical protein TGVEG_288550 [Toxoplasma gondii VEG]KAF4644346.1 hypothetical protein TGRH88_013390 [Toxoplasma gondii]KFG28899.1 hypothetical protein TGP89_288550 [Toxoplasma gondii p89]KFG42817.1 hypothetical protein TGDOM2_288550 [Toxoplasma gondii GAB2-2007-GAL-DOM2]KFG53212.1 hypothetical protein TGFOU_288550 [Toxoplasma gondii FOU]KFG62578.1 hypothetical protein TGRUB_288550 [Toxoplasma gondii RUB]KFH08815.1 hy
MAGPDSKRMYLSIVAQNIDKIKSEKPYWNKNFVPITASGAGTKYTMLQAAMMLDKPKVVKYLVGHPAVDVAVKTSDGKSTLMVAVISRMPCTVLEKLLERYDLRTINELDPGGCTALDYCEPDTPQYNLLQSLGCQTKKDLDASLQGFFGNAGANVVHQRVRRKGDSKQPKEEKRTQGSALGTSSQKDTEKSASAGEKSVDQQHQSGGGDPHSASDHCVSDEDSVSSDEADDPWKLFDTPEDLLKVLQAYLDVWGDEGEDAKLCQEWVCYVTKKIGKGKGSAAVEKWNALMVSVYGEGNVMRYEPKKCAKQGTNRDPPVPAYGGATSFEQGARYEEQQADGSEKRTDDDTRDGIERPDPDILKNFFDPTAPPVEMRTPRKPPPADGGPRVVGLRVNKEEARKQFPCLLGPKSRSSKKRGSKKN